MRKRIIALIMVAALALLVASCVEINEIEYIKFESYPKTIYLIGEDQEVFSVVYKLKNGTEEEPLYSTDDRVKTVGFSTDSAGTFTMRVYIEGYEDVSINFVYTVVNSMIDTLFAGGYGTEEEPYQIETPQQLSNIRFSLDSHYVLNNDIDLEGVVWDPIGEATHFSCGEGCGGDTIESAFTGSLSGENEGNDYKIMNLETIAAEHDTYGENWIENFALFHVIDSATIKNIVLEDVDLYGHRVGTLAYIIRGDSLIENVTATGHIRTSSEAGGIFLTSRELDNNTSDTITIRNVISYVDIVGERDSNYANMIGGLLSQTSHAVGVESEEDLLLIDSFVNYGDITHLYSEHSGTIAGQIIGQGHNGNVEIKNSSGTGIIIGNAINNTRTSYVEDGETKLTKDWEWSFYGYKYDGDSETLSAEPAGHYSDRGLDEGKLIGRILSPARYNNYIYEGCTND